MKSIIHKTSRPVAACSTSLSFGICFGITLAIEAAIGIANQQNSCASIINDNSLAGI